MTFTLPEASDVLTREDLRHLTEELITQVTKMLRRCVDADVTFEPVDPQASDPAAAAEEEQNVAWTLGHIIVHMTASAEESAALAAELARGVSYHGRSRYEVLWTSVTTVAECRARLLESGRMCSASLDMWPDRPHFEISHPYLQQAEDGQGPIAGFLLGLRHGAAHLDQLRDVIAQARAYRKQQTFLGRWRTARNARRKSRGSTAA
jgi:hypothetical protein